MVDIRANREKMEVNKLDNQNFQSIKPEGKITLVDAQANREQKLAEIREGSRRLPIKDGRWDGKAGDSVWLPDKDKVAPNSQTNPDGKTWGEIFEQYPIEGIRFRNGEPDFSEVS